MGNLGQRGCTVGPRPHSLLVARLELGSSGEVRALLSPMAVLGEASQSQRHEQPREGLGLVWLGGRTGCLSFTVGF